MSGRVRNLSGASRGVNFYLASQTPPICREKSCAYRFNDENYRRSTPSLAVGRKKSGNARHAVTLTKPRKFRFSNGAPAVTPCQSVALGDRIDESNITGFQVQLGFFRRPKYSGSFVVEFSLPSRDHDGGQTIPD